MYNAQFQNPSFGPPPSHHQKQSSHNKLQPMMSQTNPPPSPKPYTSTSSGSRPSYEVMPLSHNASAPTFGHPSSGSQIQDGQTMAREEQGNMYYSAQDVDQWAVSTAAAAASGHGAATAEHTFSKKASDGVMLSPSSGGSLDDELQQQNMQQIFEKKRRRRESHNAVERRRRDNINERINDLASLLPDRDATRANKGTILKKSVEHIRALHDKLNQYQQRIQELESMLGMYRVHEHPDAGATMMTGTHSIDLSTGMSSHLTGHDPFRHGR